MHNADEGETTQTKQTEVVTSEEADSTVQLNQVEQCWKLRRPFFEVFDQNQHEDSRESAKMLLQWLIYPVENDKFIKYHTTLMLYNVYHQFLLCCSSRELWERKPLLLKRHRPYYNDGIFSSAELDQILREVQCFCTIIL